MVAVLAYGADAVLAEYASLDAVIAAAAAVRGMTGVVDVVPAARTVLVRFDGLEPPGLRPALLGALVPGDGNERAATLDAQVVTIEVTYDGEDLAAVGAATGMGVEEVIARHLAPTYTAAFCGFAPGFTYLAGLDPALQLPRRETPRTRVPAGAVAIAAEFTAVYPTASPGGWHLLGSTTAEMFLLERDPPALVEPGARVRFQRS